MFSHTGDHMLKIRKLKKTEQYILPMVLPVLFWADAADKKANYFLCFRALSRFIEYEPSRYVGALCVVQYRKGLLGTECWVCLDTDNGNPDCYDRKFYCWIFNTKEEAEEQYQLHKNNKRWASLRKPIRCVVVESYGE